MPAASARARITKQKLAKSCVSGITHGLRNELTWLVCSPGRLLVEHSARMVCSTPSCHLAHPSRLCHASRPPPPQAHCNLQLTSPGPLPIPPPPHRRLQPHGSCRFRAWPCPTLLLPSRAPPLRRLPQEPGGRLPDSRAFCHNLAHLTAGDQRRADARVVRAAACRRLHHPLSPGTDLPDAQPLCAPWFCCKKSRRNTMGVSVRLLFSLGSSSK